MNNFVKTCGPDVRSVCDDILFVMSQSPSVWLRQVKKVRAGAAGVRAETAEEMPETEWGPAAAIACLWVLGLRRLTMNRRCSTVVWRRRKGMLRQGNRLTDKI